MNEVALIRCGSHLYGTAVPSSDEDFKVVYIPTAREILLGQADNTCGKLGDDDVEYMTLARYMKLLCQGQTNAMDMLFAPDEAHYAVPISPIWRGIQASAPDYWISRKCEAFVGYCKQQVGKYVVKKERFEAFKRVVAYLEVLLTQCEPNTKLRDISGSHDAFVKLSHLTEIDYISLKSGDKIPHLSVCDLKVPLTASVEIALRTYQHKVEQYGKRIRNTESTSSKDWKSMYHAVRVAREAIELLKTGKLTFPRPEAELLLAIRRGEVPFEEVGNTIQQGLHDVEKAILASDLQEEPDLLAAERFVIHHYGTAVREMAL